MQCWKSKVNVVQARRSRWKCTVDGRVHNNVLSTCGKIAYFRDMEFRILLYEDNARLRQSLEQLLAEGSGFRIIASFPDCSHIESEIDLHYPDLIIMDIDMPVVNGIEGVRRVRQHAPEVKVIMYTVFDDDARVFECICAGADGYLLKKTSPIRFIQALNELMEGGAPMSPAIAQKVFQFFRQKSQPASNEFGLTPREKEILESLVHGNSYKMIADQCQISLDTVRKHLKNIYHKLHVQCGTEAVVKAIRHKIIHLD
jgi:DNA-binding NarL/FixJ family response regulator